MSCKAGMTTNPQRRAEELESEHGKGSLRMIATGLTRSQAEAKLAETRKQHDCDGPDPKSEPDIPNASWFVYIFEY